MQIFDATCAEIQKKTLKTHLILHTSVLKVIVTHVRSFVPKLTQSEVVLAKVKGVKQKAACSHLALKLQ